jgi:hypothetical protein
MKQCLTIAEAVQGMVQTGALPVLGEEPGPESPTAGPAPDKARLQVVK